MLIYAYFCGMIDEAFTDRDEKQVDRMCRALDDPMNDMWTYETEDGPVLYWEKDGKIHGEIFGHDEREIPRSAIANGGR